MQLGFAEPVPTDYQYLTTPASSQVVSFVINRGAWSNGKNAPLDTGWIPRCSAYGHVSLLIPVLIGPGTDGNNSTGASTSELDPSGAANPTLMTLDDVAAGVWDSLFNQMFAIIAGGVPNATLRMGNEWWGQNWYPWSGPTLGAKGRAVYRHLVDLARAHSATFTYEWMGGLVNTYQGFTMTDMQNFYPGDDYVDYIGADPYDGQTGIAGQAGWDFNVANMTDPLAFAAAHGKKYNLTEWGLYNVAQEGHGNDDDPGFIAAAHTWMRANAAKLGWCLFFQNPPSIYTNTPWDGRLQNNPQSAAVFTALFGAWAQELAGNGRPRFVTPGFGPIGAVSPVGSLAHAKGTALRTLAVNPTAVGNALILSVLNFSATTTVSTVTGGGATWTKIVNTRPGIPQGDIELWLGVVTAKGPSTITVTDADTGTTILGCQEFTIGTPATWAVDTSAGSSSTGSAASGTYPSVTPAAVNELFVGTGLFAGGGVAGTASGFTYDAGNTSYEANAQFVYSTTASTPTAQAPPWTQTSGIWAAVSALVTASAVDPTAGSHRQRLH